MLSTRRNHTVLIQGAQPTGGAPTRDQIPAPLNWTQFGSPKPDAGPPVAWLNTR